MGISLHGLMEGFASKLAKTAAKVEKGAVKVAQREAEFGIKLGHAQNKVGDSFAYVGNKVGDAKNGAVQLWKNDLAKTREHINLAKTKVADAKNGAVQLWKNDLAKTREHIDLAKTKVADAKNGAVQFLKDDVAKTGDHINLAKTKVGETIDNLSTKAVEMKDATVDSVVSTAQGVKQGAVENVADAKNGAVQLWKNDLAKTREHIDLAKTKVADAKNGAVQFLKDDVAKTGDHINLAKTKVGETVDNLSTKAVEMKDATVNSVVSTAQGVKQGAVENVDAFVANRALARLNKVSAAEFGGLFRKLNGEQKALFQQQASGISDYKQLTAIAKGLLGA